MTITTRDWQDRADIWCDGCGAHCMVPSCNWSTVLAAIAVLDWITVPYDYGWGIGFEHFCGGDCLDDDDDGGC